MSDTWPWKTPECGIYFNMSFEEYLSIPCLQSSTIKDLLKSPTMFWSKSWMNPLRDDFKKDIKAYEEGRAYHMRILEGKAIYDAHYAPDYEDDPSDDTIIRTGDDLRTALRHAKLPMSFQTKHQGIERLLKEKPHARILDIEKKKHRAKYPKNIEFIDAATHRYIEFSAKQIECSKHLKSYFAGGYPEVTIIFDCPITGIRCKIRPDYLKVSPVCDLKSFANTFDEPVNSAIIKTMNRFLYQIQSRIYMHGVNIAKQYVKQGKVHGAENVNPEWLKAFSETPCEEFWFCFVQKGLAPVTRGRKQTLRDKSVDDAFLEYIVPAAEVFKKNYADFGEGFWIDDEPDEYISNIELWGL